MVDCGVAVELEEETMFDQEGNIVDNPSKMYGRPSKYCMIKPERCLFVDETGCNTNQKTDGNIGGEKFVVSVEQTENGRNGVVTDLNFTVLPFISGTGEAVMCAVILKSNKKVSELPIKWRRGIDVTVNPSNKETSIEFMEESLSETCSMRGGPRCTYNGRDIPCFVCASPKSSITTELLVQMLKFIYDSGLFPRNGPNHTPFLLLDGHQARTKLEFLEYFGEEGHKWKCCIGVPYATHIWQPADSIQLNGAFKIALTKAKLLYLDSKPENIKAFKPTDVIPLINMAWEQSFGRTESAKKAILERGWLVLNYVLLDDKRLINDTDDGTAVPADENSESDEESEIDLQAVRKILKNINCTGTTYLDCLDLLLQEEQKYAGRKRAYLEAKAQEDDKFAKVEHLEKVGNITSAKLAVNNMYDLISSHVSETCIGKHSKKSNGKKNKISKPVREKMNYCRGGRTIQTRLTTYRR
jgi:hypothetical protein